MRGLLLITLLAACSSTETGPTVTCGEGTVLDDERSECLPAPAAPPDDPAPDGAPDGAQDDPEPEDEPPVHDLEEDVAVGGLTIDSVSVPDRLAPGEQFLESFSVTNGTQADIRALSWRLSLFPQERDTVQAYLDALPTPETTCDEADDCDAGSACETEGGRCHLRPHTLAWGVVKNLASGGTTAHEYTVGLPPGFEQAEASETYRVVLSVGESPLTLSRGGVVHDTAAAGRPGGTAVAQAQHNVLLSGAVEVRIPDRSQPALLLLRNQAGSTAKIVLSNNSFELDDTTDRANGLFSAHLRMAGLGHPLREPAAVSFELRFATGVEDDGTYGYADSTWFPLDVEAPDPVGRRISSKHVFGQGCAGAGEECRETVWPQDEAVEGTFVVHMPTDRTRQLLAAVHSNGLSEYVQDRETGELPCQLRAKLSFGEDPRERSVETLADVVMMPPAAGPFDPPAPPDGEQPAPDGGDDEEYDRATYEPQNYAETFGLTPTMEDGLGNEFFGSRYRVHNEVSWERELGAVTKLRVEIDDHIDGTLLKERFRILGVTGFADWGSKRPVRKNKAWGEVYYQQFTLFEWDYEDVRCTEEGHTVECPVLRFHVAGSSDGRIEAVDGLTQIGTNMITYSPPGKKVLEPILGPWKFDIPSGLPGINLHMRVRLVLNVGLEGALTFKEDTTDHEGPIRGLQAHLGPFLSTTATVFGGVAIPEVARAGVEGTVVYIKAAFRPTLVHEVKQSTQGPNDRPCLFYNFGQTRFRGVQTLELLSGRVAVAAYVGGFAGIEVRVAYIPFLTLDPVYRGSWTIWDKALNHRNKDERHRCPEAPTPGLSWKSPANCKTMAGARGYCRREEHTTSFYLGPSRCGTLLINGATELGRDKLTFGDGRDLHRGGGHFLPTKPWACNRLPDAAGRIPARQPGGRLLCGPTEHGEEHPFGNYGDFLTSFEGPYSGEFSDFELSVCEAEEITVTLEPDEVLSREGVSIELRRRDEAEDWLVSGVSGWSVGSFEEGWSALGAMQGEYTWPAVVRNGLQDRPWNGTAAAGDDFEDVVAAAAWIWAPRTPAQDPFDMNQEPAAHPGPIYLRRPFIAGSSRFKFELRCDNLCELFVNGVEIPLHADGDTYRPWNSFTQPARGWFTAEDDELTMLAIKAQNSGGPAGVHFMAVSDPEEEPEP